MLLTTAIIILCVIGEHLPRYLLRDFIELSYNSGTALGLMSDFPAFVMLVSFAGFAVVICWAYSDDLDPFEHVGLAMMAGGAVSNMGERLILGYVIDWIPMIFFPDLISNVADIEIALGFLISFIGFSR